MRCNEEITEINRLLFQYKVVADKVNENIKNGISATTCQIAKILLVYPAAKWLVKKVYNTQNDISYRLQQCLTKITGRKNKVYISEYL